MVDDGSTDGSADFVQSLGISKIRVIRCPENRGAAAARNLSVAAASGHYIAFLDSDDSWEPNKLALQVAALENAAPGFLACGTDFYLWHEGPRTLVRTGLTPAKFRKDILFGCSISPGSTLMVAREAFEKVGSFNELLRRLEDWDWLLRYVEYGETLFVSQPLAHIHLAHIDATRADPDPVLQAIYCIRAEHLPSASEKRRHRTTTVREFSPDRTRGSDVPAKPPPRLHPIRRGVADDLSVPKSGLLSHPLACIRQTCMAAATSGDALSELGGLLEIVLASDLPRNFSPSKSQ